MVQLLLLKGADKDALDNNEWTPLYLATVCGHEAAALALIAAGADVSLRYGDYKESVVHAAAQRRQVATLRAAIKSGVDVNAENTMQETPLHFAARSKNKAEAVDVLVAAGADIEARDSGGHTPLHRAAAMLNLEALLTLLKHGAQVNAQTKGQHTPLHIAAVMTGMQGAAEVVDSLLRSGADETILDDDGQAAADLVGIDAEEEGHLAEDVEHVRQLLANAPADRAWRRRGYLVLCRSHPDRMQQIQESSGVHAGMAQRTRSRAKQGRIESSRCSGAVDASHVDERDGGDWAGLVVRVLALQEEGIFRTIVGYL